MTAFVVPGFAVTKTLDNTAVQRGVSDILTSSYQVDNVTAVSCPSGQKVKSGTTFSCSAVIDGTQVSVPIRVVSDDGRYEVGEPTPK